MNELEDLVDVFASSRVSRTCLPDRTGVVLDIAGRKVMSINASGQFVIEQLARGKADEGEIVGLMAAEFKVDEDAARRDLRAFVSQLRELLFQRR